MITFYSFKGGVGRTQALVNVGVELAQRGRRVLLVDFDLEAPGLDTFDLPRSRPTCPGIVEYVTQFRHDSVASDVNEFLYEVTLGDKRVGGLWVMPAGHQDPTYAQRLASIDWVSLYRDHDGYLLFEDLKLQWETALAPDYVLIDSRTGHTDVRGICTRQLPDSVIIFFLPTRENQRGLDQVVSDIREDAKPPRSKRIHLDFVMANVPDIDDEEQILEARMRELSRALGYDTLTQTIHRYNSLALLNQVVFTRDRPKTRLAREYRELTDSIVAQNPADREAVLGLIRGLLVPHGELGGRMQEIEERVATLTERFSADGEVLFTLGRLRLRQGRIDESISFFNQAIAAGYGEPDIFLRRGQAREFLGDTQGATADVAQMFALPGATDSDMGLGISILRKIAPEVLWSLSGMAAIKGAPVQRRIWVARELRFSLKEALAAAEILRSLRVEPDLPSRLRQVIGRELMLCLIALGRFSEASEALAGIGEVPEVEKADVFDAFNFAMAEWGRAGTPPIPLLKRVVQADTLRAEGGTANYEQCLALTLSLLGRREPAMERLNRARQKAMTRPAKHFSCWRYLLTDAATFLTDLEELRRMISGETVTPLFLEGAALKHKGTREGEEP